MTDERTIEAYLRKRVKELGGIHRKVTYHGRRGSPDDWCFFPGGVLLLFECKSSAGRLRAEQREEIKTLQKLGQHVYIVRTKDEIDRILDERP